MPNAGNRRGGFLRAVGIVLVLVLAALLLLAMLLPATVSRAPAWLISMNNMKEIVLAMLQFESKEHHLPARAIFDKHGKPLLSWRVQLLPYLELQSLYNEFHLDEPWDSPHNRKVADIMPAVFQNPNRPTDNKTNYLVPAGPGTVFDGARGIKLDDITDGPAHTLMLVEADEDQAVIWTKPDDLDVDLEYPLEGLGHFRRTGVLAALCDGSVRTVPPTITPAMMKALLTRAGGEKIPPGVTD